MTAVSNIENLPFRWPRVRPFDAYDVPPFPVDALPPPLGPYVAALAEATQTPADMPAMLVIGAVASANSKKFVVRFSSDWAEPLNLFIALAMPPASRKSAVFSECTLPLRDYEAGRIEATKDEIDREKSRHSILESRKAELERKVAKETDFTNLAAFQALLDDVRGELLAHIVPPIPRLIAADVTPERLANLLCEQGGKLAVMAPEGGLFDIITGRYTRGQPNIDVLLNAHSGDDLRVDRLNRPPEFVRAPALTVNLAIQPDVLRGLMSRPGLHGRGLLARFLYSLPNSNVGHRRIISASMPNALRREYHQLITCLLEMAVDSERPKDLLLTSQAGTLFNGFRAQVETRLASYSQFGVIQDWAGKLPGAVLRIAGNLHLAKYAVYHQIPAIEVGTMQNAIQIGEYLAEHARCAYDLMGADPQIALCKVAWGHILSRQWYVFTKNELNQALRSRVRTAQEWDGVLNILVERGFIRPVNEDEGGTGRPSKIFEVNPAVLSTSAQNAEYTQNPEDLEYHPPEINEEQGAQRVAVETVDTESFEMEEYSGEDLV